MITIDRTTREPLWSQVHADLLTRLAAGEFSDGFPGEVRLRQDYGLTVYVSLMLNENVLKRIILIRLRT